MNIRMGLGGLGWTLAAAILLPASAQAAGDPALGKAAFAEHCAACHSLEPGKHRKGPSLAALIGRTAGSAAGFKYSGAMQRAGFVWSEAQLDGYLTAPKAVVPGGSMKFDGLADAAVRADLIAYLTAQP